MTGVHCNVMYLYYSANEECKRFSVSIIHDSSYAISGWGD